MTNATPNPQSRRCTALRRDGQPCRAWALRASLHPPRCAVHTSQDEQAPPTDLTTHQDHPSAITLDGNKAFYAPGYTAEELGAVSAITQPNSLSGEIMMVRGQLRRLVIESRTDPPHNAITADHRAAILFTGARTIANLLTAERQLELTPEGIPLPIAETLDEMSEEWGIDL